MKRRQLSTEFRMLPMPPTDQSQVKTSDEFHLVLVQTERTDSESRVGKLKASFAEYSNGGGASCVFAYGFQLACDGKLYGRSRATQSQMIVRSVRPMVAWRRLIPGGSEGSGRFIAAA